MVGEVLRDLLNVLHGLYSGNKSSFRYLNQWSKTLNTNKYLFPWHLDSVPGSPMNPCDALSSISAGRGSVNSWFSSSGLLVWEQIHHKLGNKPEYCLGKTKHAENTLTVKDFFFVCQNGLFTFERNKAKAVQFCSSGPFSQIHDCSSSSRKKILSEMK